MMNERESRKIEVVLERGRLQVRLAEDRGDARLPTRRIGQWLIERMGWLAFGLGIATWVQTL